MKKADVDYIKSLIPKDVPDGKKLVEEGVKIGEKVAFGESLFLKEKGYETYDAYRETLIKEGKVNWQILMGLGTLEDEIEGIKKAYEYGKETGLEFSAVQHVTDQLSCLPESYREGAPSSTAFMVETSRDRERCMEAAALQQIFEDHTLSCPNSLETTTAALRASSPRVGILSQFIWDYYGFTDDLKRYSDMMKSIGMVKAHGDKGISIDTFMDDGIPSYFIDCVSYVGYALLEDYIITDLCQAPLTVAYGGLLSEAKPRICVGLAIDKCLSKNGRKALSYINSSTNWQWETNMTSNYGPSAIEMFLQILVEKKYKLGWQINPVSISEKVTVPTLQDLLDIVSVGMRTEAFADDWEGLINFKTLEDMRDKMAEEGTKWFENVLAYFKEAGVDIENPLEMIMVLKKFNYPKLEEIGHSTTQTGQMLIPFFPTVLGRQTADLRDEIIKDLKAKNLKNPLEGKKIVCISADGHSYGLVLIDGVFKAMGAEVINGGVNITTPAILLDLADEEDANIICISAHNGQALEYSKQVMELAEKREKKYHIYMGGILKAILPGDSEPSDVTAQVNEVGVFGSNDLETQIKHMMAI